MKLKHCISILRSRFRSTLVAGALGAFSLTAFPVGSAVAQDLTIGSEAPKLDIEHWLSDRDGEFSEVTEFESGKVYVVEFWATWCGPCIASMPHLVKLQNDYASKGVQIISVSKEKLETVEKFLDRDVKQGRDPDADQMTYAQLTGQYCLTTDPDSSVNDDYMKAAKRRGIPCAFIVGKSGLIEWIGHPAKMDEALEGVVDDSWDREAFGEVFAEEIAAKARFDELLNEVRKLSRKDDFEGAFEKIEEFAATLPAESAQKGQLQMLRSSLAISAGGEFAIEAMRSVADSKNPALILQTAFRVLQHGKRSGELNEELAAVVLKATDDVIELTDKDQIRSMAFLTKARTLLQLDRFDESSETVKQAIEIREDKFLLKFLEEVEAAKEEAAGASDGDGDAEASEKKEIEE